MSDAIVIDTPEGIEHYYFASTIAMLSIEVSTGMVHSRGSVLKVAQNRYGVTARTKAKGLKELKEKYKEKYNREYGGR